MPEISLPLSTGSARTATTHPVHRATVLLQEALHDSRRATFTQEFGEVRGIHRLSAPAAPSPAEVFEDDSASDFVSPPTNLDFVGAYLGHPLDQSEEDILLKSLDLPRDAALPPARSQDTQDEAPIQAADRQLRGLIHDFQERQRRASLIVAGSVASAVTLTIVTIALVFALAT